MLIEEKMVNFVWGFSSEGCCFVIYSIECKWVDVCVCVCLICLCIGVNFRFYQIWYYHPHCLVDPRSSAPSNMLRLFWREYSFTMRWPSNGMERIHVYSFLKLFINPFVLVYLLVFCLSVFFVFKCWMHYIIKCMQSFNCACTSLF